MSIANPTHATVKRSLLKNKRMAEGLAALDTLCTAGAQCPAVMASPAAVQVLADLQAAVTTAKTSLTNKKALLQALLAAIQTLKIDFGEVKVTLASYESIVNFIAHGDSSVIIKAGCQARGPNGKPSILGQVTGLTSKPGKLPTEGILQWPVVTGATSYAIELNFTPENPAGPWTPIGPGSRRRRVVKTATPGGQLLARVAALGSDGTQTAWSDPLLVTTL